MWVCQGLCVVAAIFGAGVPLAQALHEDEVGQYEWIVQQVGHPTALAYSIDAADKVFVASASGVIASMLLKDGTLQWRRVAAGPGSMTMLKAGSRGLLSVTDHGLVQFWKGSTGDLTWQREYSDKVVDLHIVGPSSKQSVVVVRESEVEVRSTAGKHEWSVPIMDGNRIWAAAPAQGDGVICAVSAKQGGVNAQAMQIDVNSGKQTKTTSIPASTAKALESSKFLVVDRHLVVLTADTITVQQLCGEGQAETFEMRKIKSSGKVPFQLMPWQRTPGVFAATNGVTTAIFGVSDKGLKHLRTFEGVAVVGPVHSVHDDETGQPVAVAIVGQEGTKIQLLDPASGNVQPAINAEGYTAKDHGPARLLLVRELSSGEHHTVISAADHSLVGMQGSKVNWVREEALTGIREAVFYTRPGKHKSKKVEVDSLSSVIPALAAQLGQLPAMIGTLAKKPAELSAAAVDFLTGMGKEPKRQKPTLLPNAKAPANADELRGFGANKLILCATRANKLFALEATTSEIVWQRYFANGAELLEGSSGECATSDAGDDMSKCGLWMRLLPSASSFYSELVVLTPAPADANQATQSIHWIDPLTGKDMHAQDVPGGGAGIISIMTLPRTTARDAAKVQPFLLVDTKRKAHLVPSDKAEHAKLLEEHADRLFHFEVNRPQQVVQGYAVSKSAGSADLVRLWNIELGSVGERIVASTAPAHREWGHVPVHIKGDASILYKYINTNTIAVATEDQDVKSNTTSLNLYVLDAVTGHVLHQSRIPGASEPVHMVGCDNWVLMHYWNEKRTRFELTVVEMFESKADDGPWNILFGGKQGQNFTMSAHHLESPVPLQQTYIFPTGVTSMGVTATMKGITPRSIIMALTTDHLYTISKDMLNPRRPYMTPGGVPDKERGVPPQFAPTKEEPVPPYAPIMPLRPTDVLTYYNPMGKVTGIVSSPTTLESTSLIFSYGLDLFFTPVQTAKAYDVLSPGFNYTLLYTSVGSVVAVLVVTSFWSTRRNLQERWK